MSCCESCPHRAYCDKVDNCNNECLTEVKND